VVATLRSRPSVKQQRDPKKMIQDFKRTAEFIRTHPIGGRTHRSCWKRWLQWQLGSRLLPYPVALPWIADACLMTEKGMTGATGNWYCGLHEFADMALLLHFFGGPGEGEGSFLDIGANVGSYTVLASKVCGARSLAFEPVRETFKRLIRNVKINKIESIVEARQLAVGGKSGTIRFTADQDTTNQVADQSYQGSVFEVGVVALDEVLKSKARLPSFWKIDVEGFKLAVLKGAASSLRNKDVQVVLLEGGDEEIDSSMRSYGFKSAEYDVFARSLTPSGAEGPSNNNLWVRALERVQSRCRAAREFDIFGVRI